MTERPNPVSAFDILRSDDPTVRIEAIQRLAETGSPEAIQELINVANGTVRREEFKTVAETEKYRPHWYSVTRSSRIVHKQVQIGPSFGLDDQLIAITAL